MGLLAHHLRSRLEGRPPNVRGGRVKLVSRYSGKCLSITESWATVQLAARAAHAAPEAPELAVAIPVDGLPTG